MTSEVSMETYTRARMWRNSQHAAITSHVWPQTPDAVVGKTCLFLLFSLWVEHLRLLCLFMSKCSHLVIIFQICLFRRKNFVWSQIEPNYYDRMGKISGAADVRWHQHALGGCATEGEWLFRKHCSCVSFVKIFVVFMIFCLSKVPFYIILP
jgi:hypothetical protein